VTEFPALTGRTLCLESPDELLAPTPSAGRRSRRIFDIDWEAATMIEQCSKCRELAGIE
jgi:hypothetical protein